MGAGPGGAALGPAPPDRAPPRYPVVLQRFELRRGSGGAGRYRGGDGVCRELLFRQDMVLSVLSERRAIQPYGLQGEPCAPRRAPWHTPWHAPWHPTHPRVPAGGSPGALGLNLLLRRDGPTINLGAKTSVPVQPGVRCVCPPPWPCAHCNVPSP